MKKSLKLSFQKGDWFAIAGVIVLAVAVAGFFGMSRDTSQTKIVQILQNSQLIQEYPLDTEETIYVDDMYHNVIEISDGKVAIVESDCPGEDCVHSGWINRAGRSIVCLPNKVEIRIVGITDDVDIIVR